MGLKAVLSSSWITFPYFFHKNVSLGHDTFIFCGNQTLPTRTRSAHSLCMFKASQSHLHFFCGLKVNPGPSYLVLQGKFSPLGLLINSVPFCVRLPVSWTTPFDTILLMVDDSPPAPPADLYIWLGEISRENHNCVENRAKEELSFD